MSVIIRLSGRNLLVNGVILLVLVPFFVLGCSQGGTSTPVTSNPVSSATSPQAALTPTPSPSPTPSGITPSVPASTPTASGATAPAGYSISVMYNNNPVQYLTVADLSKLPQVQANVEGTAEQGPTLLSALNSIGIIEFTSVTIDGFTKGRIATAEITLTRLQVTDNVMLALVTRGTAKLTGTDIGAAKAIIDVSQITVK